MRSWLKIITCLAAGLYLAPPANSMHWQRGTPVPPQLIERAPSLAADSHPERVIVAALTAVRENRLDDANRLIDALLATRPNYRLAHLIKGDLLLARAQPLAQLGNTDASDKLTGLRNEALQRLARHDAPTPTGVIPANLLQLAPSQEHAVVVDASSARIYLFRNDQGTPRYLTDFYATIGKLGFGKSKEGDQRTPLGVYFVTGHMPRTELDQRYGVQAELYGIGAWPISYPNDWDRQQGRTGHGIWLHGVPFDTYSRAPQASNGCVALSNADMGALASMLKPGTPVVITPSIEWLKPTEWRSRQQAAQAEIDAWRRDWESLDTPRYLAHYGRSFKVGNTDLTGWNKQKAQVNAGKRWAKVALNDMSLFFYPTAGEPMLMANFNQDYRSDNLENQMRKRLYLQREEGDWKVVYEGAAG